MLQTNGFETARPTPMSHVPFARAGLRRRMMCIVYEALIAFSLLVFFGYAFSALTQYTGQPGVMRWAFQLWLITVLAGYFSWSWSQGRCSLPMKTLGLRIVDRDHAPISPARALGRYLLALLGIVVPIGLASAWGMGLLSLLALPALTAWLDPDGRTPYDWLSGTRLVKAPVPSASPRSAARATAPQPRTQSTK